MKTEKNPHMYWLDAAKGIGIILVVIGHSERGLVSSGIAPESWKSGIDFYLYTFHMPLFMLLAGVNAPKSMHAGRYNFLKRKIATVVWPYFLWSIIFGILIALLGSVANGRGSWHDIFLIGWRPIGPFWFLYSLFIYSLIFSIATSRALILAAISIVAFVFSQEIKEDTLIHGTLHFFVFYMMGVLISKKMVDFKGNPTWLTVLAMGTIWLCASAAIGNISNYNYFSSWALPSAILGSATVIALGMKVKGLFQLALCALGRASMPIYVMHVLGTAGTRIILHRSGLTDSPILHLLIGTAIGIAAPYGVYIVTKKLGWLAALGFGQSRILNTVQMSAHANH